MASVKKVKKYGYLVRVQNRIHVGLTTVNPRMFGESLTEFGLSGGEVLACGEPKGKTSGWNPEFYLGDTLLGGFGVGRVYGRNVIEIPRSDYSICLDGVIDGYHEIYNPENLRDWLKYLGRVK